MSDPEYIYKVILTGDARVGKTSLRLRYLGKGFDGNYLHTIGADFAVKKVKKENFSVQFQIWDLSGQQGFAQVRAKYYSKAKVVILVFSIIDSNSFYNVYNWLVEYNKNKDTDETIFFLVGNKIDLNHERQVTAQDIKSQIKKFQREFGVEFTYYETSALSGQNVDLLFDTIIEKKTETQTASRFYKKVEDRPQTDE